MKTRSDIRDQCHVLHIRPNVVVPIAILLLGLSGSAMAAQSDEARRDACNTWLATGVQPRGLTRADCNFAEDRPQGSILRPGTSEATRIWREQADHQNRFVLDTGSEAKEEPPK